MKWIAAVTLAIFCPFALAQEAFGPSFQLSLETSVPTFLGLGAGITFGQDHTVYLGLGRIPLAYSSAVGSAAAQLGENDAYRDLTEAALQDNGTLKIGYRYRFAPKWSAYFHYQGIRGSGEGDIATVLEASTGNEYPNLTNALIDAGRDPSVDLESELHSVELGISYSLPVSENILFQLQGGLLRIYSADVALSTGLSNFDSSALGQATLDQAETDTEAILLEYGWVPTLGAAFQFLF